MFPIFLASQFGFSNAIEAVVGIASGTQLFKSSSSSNTKSKFKVEESDIRKFISAADDVLHLEELVGLNVLEGTLSDAKMAIDTVCMLKEEADEKLDSFLSLLSFDTKKTLSFNPLTAIGDIQKLAKGCILCFIFNFDNYTENKKREISTDIKCKYEDLYGQIIGEVKEQIKNSKDEQIKEENFSLEQVVQYMLEPNSLVRTKRDSQKIRTDALDICVNTTYESAIPEDCIILQRTISEEEKECSQNCENKGGEEHINHDGKSIVLKEDADTCKNVDAVTEKKDVARYTILRNNPNYNKVKSLFFDNDIYSEALDDAKGGIYREYFFEDIYYIATSISDYSGLLGFMYILYSSKCFNWKKLIPILCDELYKQNDNVENLSSEYSYSINNECKNLELMFNELGNADDKVKWTKVKDYMQLIFNAIFYLDVDYKKTKYNSESNAKRHASSKYSGNATMKMFADKYDFDLNDSELKKRKASEKKTNDKRRGNRKYVSPQKKTQSIDDYFYKLEAKAEN